MKGLAVVVVVLALVVSVAVAGSQAQPLPRTNPALGMCQPPGRISPDAVRCKPVILLAAAGELENEFAGEIGGNLANEVGGDNADPEFLVKVAADLAKAFIVALAVDLAQRFMDWAFGGTAPNSAPVLAHVDTSIFDAP